MTSPLPYIATGPTPFELEWLAPEGSEDGPTVFETSVPMRDGIELAADVYLPAKSELPVPVIVEMTPYGKSAPGHDHSDALYFRSQGYAYVVVDCRGRGKSEGEWEPFIHDAEDGYDTVEWAAARPWSTGKVGITGLSYGGWVTWATASERPPHLTCMVSSAAVGRYMQEAPYVSGAFQTYFVWWLYMVRRRILELQGLREIDWDTTLRTIPLGDLEGWIDGRKASWDQIVEANLLDERWKNLRLDERYAAIDFPCLHVAGWYDLEDLPGAFHHYQSMLADSPAADQQHLIVGPWSHVKTRHPDSECGGVEFGRTAAVDMDAVHLRWFDYWLKGIDNGTDADPRVTVFEPGGTQWRTGSRWPFAGTPRTFYLRNLDGGVLADSPAQDDADLSYRYDPADPVPTGIDVDRYPLVDPPLEQTANESRADVITYTTPPLDEDLVVSGWGSLLLEATSSCDDTDWHVKVTDVHPDGRSYRVSQGSMRASYRASLTEEPTPLTPGVSEQYEIELWPMQHRFRAGHRIRLQVTSSDFPWYARSLNRFGHIARVEDPRVADNTLHHRAGGFSRLLLPVEHTSE